jgi:CCR4-NOT complex subunit CAF16
MNQGDPAIKVDGIDFRYSADLPLALEDLQLELGRGQRCLLVGANGAGKTTLLRLIGGKHLIRRGELEVLGRPAFHDTSLAGRVAFLGGSFPFEVDVRVGDMLARAATVPDRCERLVDLLAVDLDWHMHRISAGQRRRVQLLLGLMHPFEVLLLDEITTDLDIIARSDLLAFLRDEAEQRGVTILYATHILDRLEHWATHLAFVEQGRVVWKDRISALAELDKNGGDRRLSALVEGWLRGGAPGR